MFVETNSTLLVVTIVVSILHLLFDLLVSCHMSAQVNSCQHAFLFVVENSHCVVAKDRDIVAEDCTDDMSRLSRTTSPFGARWNPPKGSPSALWLSKPPWSRPPPPTPQGGRRRRPRRRL